MIHFIRDGQIITPIMFGQFTSVELYWTGGDYFGNIDQCAPAAQSGMKFILINFEYKW